MKSEGRRKSREPSVVSHIVEGDKWKDEAQTFAGICKPDNIKEEFVLLGWKRKVLDDYVLEGGKLRYENSGVYTKDDDDTGFEGGNGDKFILNGWKHEAQAGERTQMKEICEKDEMKEIRAGEWTRDLQAGKVTSLVMKK
jgi:hypothetical protein